MDLGAERARRTPAPRVLPTDEYRDSGGRLVRVRYAQDGSSVLEPICGFAARIARETALDDGSGPPALEFEIQGTAGGDALPAVALPAEAFGDMAWVTKHWGHRAVIYAGQGRKDHARAAVQMLSHPERCTVYTHTGWRRIGGSWAYLHAGGAIGAVAVQTRLQGALSRYALPGEPEDTDSIRTAVRAALGLVDAGPPQIMWPLLSLAFLCPLCEPLRAAGREPDFLTWLHGASGTRKTTVAALVCSLFGDFHSSDLPASFGDTANSLERVGFGAKDALLVVDDFRRELPDRRAREQMEQVADRLARGAGNRAGRQRLTADLQLRRGYEPRGLALATGEDLPAGESTVARLFALETRRDSVRLGPLSDAQRARHLLPVAMRAYIDWLRPQMDALPEILRGAWDEYRDAAQQHAHARLPGATAHLWVGATMLLRFAEDCGALEAPFEDAEAAAHTAIWEAAQAQAGHALQQDPALRFVRALSSVMEAGQVRVLGITPVMEPAPGAPYIGELDGGVLYLIGDAAREAVQVALARRGEAPMPSARALGQRLDEGGYLAPTSQAREPGRVTVRRRMGGELVRRTPLRWPAEPAAQDQEAGA